MMYCYVTCRPDIGYAITTLSKFSSAPAQIHFTLLKGVAKYLRATQSWGIYYKRKSPDLGLQESTEEELELPDGLPPFPAPEEIPCTFPATSMQLTVMI